MGGRFVVQEGIERISCEGAKRRLALWATGVGLTALLMAVGVGHANAAYPGSNGKIAFTSDRDGNREIYTINADGTGVTRLTDHGAEDMQPAWSADGTKIAFVSARDGNHEIYVMNADGTNVTRLTNNVFDDQTPAWSPDGTKIVFASNRGGVPSPTYGTAYSLYVMNADGTGANQLTAGSENDSTPEWSPDGQRIAFSRWDGSTFHIAVVNADGAGLTILTGGSGSWPSWSPDGQRIAFMDSGIYVVNADGTNQTLLTQNPGGDLLPAWSPDGTKIAFASGRDGNNEIYSMNVDGTGQTNLTQSGSFDYYPDWGAAPASPPTDATGPIVTCEGVPSFLLNAAGASVTATVTDSDSGPAAASVSAPADTSTVGYKTVAVTGADNAGNTTTVLCPYQVTYGFSGFAGAVKNPPIVNTGKGGRTYPLRWQLTDANGAVVTSTSAVTGLSAKSTSCAAFSDNPADALEATATGGTALRFDATSNEFVYNWATPGPGCYTLFVSLVSGQTLPAYFNLS